MNAHNRRKYIVIANRRQLENAYTQMRSSAVSDCSMRYTFLVKNGCVVLMQRISM